MGPGHSSLGFCHPMVSPTSGISFFCTFSQKCHSIYVIANTYISDSYTYVQSYPFTGKEKDSETGYYAFGARYYDSDLSGLFLSVDPMADKYPSLSPYAYCAWNPVKLVDPDGSEIDDYFSTSGKYLGSDNAETKNVRIINETTWNMLKTDGNGLIEHDVGFSASMSFSDAGSRGMSIDAQLSVYQHYNPTNNNLENLDNNGESYGMRSHFVPDADPVIQIRLEGNRNGIKVCDYADEIKNLFAHEKGHIDHYYRIGHAKYQSTSYKEREKIALDVQTKDPTWRNVHDDFKQDIIKYGKKNGVTIQ